MYCSKCGYELKDDINFCPKCGAKVTSIVPSASSNLKDTFNDPRDGKVYKTVKIGEQVWMAENLNYEIPGFFAKSNSVCYYNDPNYCKRYGRLYNWMTATKICPAGWHLPKREEWQTLVNFVGGENVAGKILKSKSGWNKDYNGTDDFGFMALPGGHSNSNGDFFFVGTNGYWWSASEMRLFGGAYYLGLCYDCDSSYLDDHNKNNLFNVRCLKD
ncbi:MAG: zinc-ribbon domain-containing protein [Fibromonadales bacterium]|nr:zinc-ribbon domain-containing protein [Fibromonadales bacterium]